MMNSKYAIAIVPLLVILLDVVPVVPLQAETIAIDPEEITIEAMADSYVNQTAPDANYGGDARLYVSSKGITYLMFLLPPLPFNATIASAKLQLYATSGSTSGSVDVHYCADDSWTEMSITWDNKPSYSAERTYRISPRPYTGWENPWYVTDDVERTYQEGDDKLTLVVVSSGAWAYYRSREATSKPKLTIYYLTSPCYRIQLESRDETGRSPNVGEISVSGQSCSLPNEILAKPGTYGLSYQGDCEFVKWETEGGISVASASSEETTVNIQGAGLIRAVGRSAGITLESVQDTGLTSNLGYVVIGDTHYTLPSDIPLIRPGTYSISYEGGYKFLRWETTGDVSVSNPNSPTTTLTVRAGTGTLRAVGSADVMGYSYDDGEAQSYQYKDEGPSEMWAVRFTPLFTGRLLRARFYVLRDPAAFRIHVMDENRTRIAEPLVRTPTAEGWFDVDLSQLDLRVKAREDIYIGIEWITEDAPGIGYDDDDPSDRRSWYWNGTSWRTYPDSYDVMIRIVVETVMLPSQITCTLGTSSVEYLGEVELSGTISPSDPETAQALVGMQYSLDGVTWSSIANVSCISSAYSYTWKPEVPAGTYMVRALWMGSETYFGSTSEHQVLTIARAHPTLTCSFDVQSAEVDARVDIYGYISPEVDSARIVLIVTAPSGYQHNHTVWTSRYGRFEFEMVLYEEGTWKAKAYWAGDENLLACESAIAELTVSQPFPWLLIGGAAAGGFALIIVLIWYLRSRKPTQRPGPLPPPPPPM